ncbi:hypothetical protein GX831_02770 [bacterium]|jgi:hypothetical protein|nr:hypothetical protein [bacterium]
MARQLGLSKISEVIGIKTSIIAKFQALILRRVFVTRALAIVSGILGLTIALTYYGINVGNFVISVEGNYVASIALTVDENKEDLRSTLIADNQRDILDADYSFIPSTVTEGLGNKYSESARYYAYSFYLVNVGTVAVNYTMEFNLVRANKQLDSILRVMIVKDEQETIYAKARETESHYGEPEPVIVGRADNIIGYTTPFIEDQTKAIIRETYYDFQENESHRYTVVMWLDGWDAEQVDEMKGAALQTEIKFTIL